MSSAFYVNKTFAKNGLNAANAIASLLLVWWRVFCLVITMDRDIGTIYALRTLGYRGTVCVRRCRCDELPCPVLTWLAAELIDVCPELEDRKTDVFLVGELRTLLTELLCPYTALTTDTLTPSLLNKVTEFMVSELQAARILQYNELHPEDRMSEGDLEKEQRAIDRSIVDLKNWCQEYEDCHEMVQGDRKAETKTEMSLLLQSLNMDESSTFTDVCHEVERRLADLPRGDMTDPLLNIDLNSEQWKQTQKMNQALLEDYQCRRQMMIIRFQVTLQSFAWGEKEKERSKVLASVPPLSSFALVSQVSMSLLLAARKDQSYVLPVKAGESTAVYKVLMGCVPDRGGRPGEIEAPMPTWKDRREGVKGRGGPRGDGGHRQKFSGKKKNKRD
ncbi:protein FAM98B [Esox lucius]|uniref:protein FAM98B n=1 Tax=Esox lucius TaxID=8010 RepID=UPI00147786EC|nr:protein FAM98B [Esox lucius]